ncbi:SWIM zinc finger family protein [Acidianus sp. HS-5]|uniref:SWIM zinc finger family protein n=1 Tax=Acidianus sp. HS-5 TaxID=2886040 RepID=UPI001F4043A3|nr:SWIM zinc finger family protein [Acidianus sp. HS-5]BDC19272.1 hypothetical protein HS5_21620 [Acidianus sp. HS-5]
MEESRLLKRAKVSAVQGRIIKLRSKRGFFSTYVFIARNESRHKDHILNENYCDCDFFVFNKIYKNRNFCYHILTLKIAMNKEKIITVDVELNDFLEIIREIRHDGKSLKLRKLIYTT